MSTTKTGRPKATHSSGMIHWIEMKLEQDAPSYQEKSEKDQRRFEYELHCEEKGLFKYEHNELDAKIVLVARRMGVLPQEEWDRLWEGRSSRTLKFMNAINEIWNKVLGYELARCRRYDGKALQWLRAKVDNPNLPVPSPRSWESRGSMPQAAEVAVTEAHGAKDSSLFDEVADCVALVLYARAEHDRQAEMRNIWQERGWNHLLERIGYRVVEPVYAVVDLEQVAHVDQNRIDDAFSRLMAEMSF